MKTFKDKLNRILLRQLKKQSVVLSKQPIELVWQQSQPNTNMPKPVSKTLSMKQPIET